MTTASTTGAGAARKPKPAVGARRVAIGVLLAVVGLAAVAWPPAFALLVLLVASGCLYEFAGLSARKGAPLELPVALAAVWTYIVLTQVGLLHRYEGVLIAVTVIVALVAAAWRPGPHYLARSGATVLGVLYVGKLLAYFVAVRALPEGALWTVWAIVLIACTDTFAMLIGSALGRHKLNAVSPGKTVEGALGGLAAALLAGAAIALVPVAHVAWWQGLLVGAIVSVAAQAGDLVESALKRDAEVKDAGSLIAGHGGVLDRFDSYLFGGPAFYFGLVLVGAVPLGGLIGW